VARPIFATSSRGEPLIDGSAPLDEVNERFGLALPLDDYDTLGGFILGELGHVPKRGDTVHYSGAQLVVEKIVERRVRLVRLLGKGEAATPPADAGPAGPAVEEVPGSGG
jgi:CBS domain containing-hemolysin-like protein